MKDTKTEKQHKINDLINKIENEKSRKEFNDALIEKIKWVKETEINSFINLLIKEKEKLNEKAIDNIYNLLEKERTKLLD